MDCSNSELTSETPSLQFFLHGGSNHHMTSTETDYHTDTSSP